MTTRTINTQLSFLDEIHMKMIDDPEYTATYFAQLVAELLDVRSIHSEPEWKQVAKEIITHPIGDLLYQDPFTARCFNKPRGYAGYAGDAVMMDYIYDCTPPVGTTEIGKAIFLQATRYHEGCVGVRHRRKYLAYVIDEIAKARPNARILSVACGHLREAALSQALREDKVQTFIALDQDAESLQTIRDQHYSSRIETVQASVMDIIKADYQPGMTFDLVYAAGLYDYLPLRVARLLTQRLFELLDHGGRLIIPNLTFDMPDVAYMESFMDWHFISRNVPDMHDLYTRIPPEQINDIFVFVSPNKTVNFLEVDKVI